MAGGGYLVQHSTHNSICIITAFVFESYIIHNFFDIRNSGSSLTYLSSEFIYMARGYGLFGIYHLLF